jgi:hypothetical protein
MSHDRRLVRSAARELVRTYRGNVLHFLLEAEYESVERGDGLSADAWFDIARVAAEILRGRRLQPFGDRLGEFGGWITPPRPPAS